MPWTTALISSFDVQAETAGMTPAIAVVANRPSVIAGLASHTRRSTLGSAAVVPVTDCLKLSQRPRRSFGPSGSGGPSTPGSPVSPLLAGPESFVFQRPDHQGVWITGGPPPCDIIAIGFAAYPSPATFIFNLALDSP